jgi:hypothetical protein
MTRRLTLILSLVCLIAGAAIAADYQISGKGDRRLDAQRQADRDAAGNRAGRSADVAAFAARRDHDPAGDGSRDEACGSGHGRPQLHSGCRRPELGRRRSRGQTRPDRADFRRHLDRAGVVGYVDPQERRADRRRGHGSDAHRVRRRAKGSSPGVGTIARSRTCTSLRHGRRTTASSSGAVTAARCCGARSSGST